MRAPRVDVIVITCNGRHHLEVCLPSLLRTNYANFRVILLDNASSDGASDYVREHFPSVTVVRHPKNYGFARGNNLVMAQSLRDGAEYLLLLNDDTCVLDPDWLREAVAAAEKGPADGDGRV